MSKCIKHTPCPSCGSRDNVGLYDDGHEWCFGCGRYVPPTDGARMQSFHDKENNKDDSDRVTLPSDVVHSFPTNISSWLTAHSITQREIILNRFTYSPSHNRLIFPVYDAYGNILMWQGRAFDIGLDGKKPRYYTQGKPEHVDHVLSHSMPLPYVIEQAMREPKTLVIVEDVISAIVVSRVMPAIPLWGSNLSLGRIKRLARRFHNLGIWLDSDKKAYAMKSVVKARPYFDKVFMIYTDQDPKCYQAPAIRDKLGHFVEVR